MANRKSTYLTAVEARAYFATTPTTDTVRRWMSKGIRVRCDGGIGMLRLKSRKEGRTRVTTAEWIADFVNTQRYWDDVSNGFEPEGQ